MVSSLFKSGLLFLIHVLVILNSSFLLARPGLYLAQNLSSLTITSSHGGFQNNIKTLDLDKNTSGKAIGK